MNLVKGSLIPRLPVPCPLSPLCNNNASRVRDSSVPSAVLQELPKANLRVRGGPREIRGKGNPVQHSHGVEEETEGARARGSLGGHGSALQES